ncbi:MAG: caspase family protein [Deltaproteobacteria bacterium]|nr:caspase family protein [Deltaproteobacteria bacterium]
MGNTGFVTCSIIFSKIILPFLCFQKATSYHPNSVRLIKRYSFQVTKMLKIFLIIVLLSINLAIIHAAGKQGAKPVNIKDLKQSEVVLYKESHALLIGVSDYTNGWPDLNSIPGEMEDIEDALKQNGFRVEKVVNPNSTQLYTAFRDFIENYGYDKDNRLLFFYSGHGYSREKGKGYLVPIDAPNPRKDEKGFLRKALTMGDILNFCRKMEAKHALFLFDSCFSGTIFESKSLPEQPPHITSYTASPVRQFITAGSAGEKVPAKSVFTPSFISALRGKADLNKDNYVTGTELGMHLHEEVIYYKTGQTPQYGKIRDPDLDKGDFVFQMTNIPTPKKDILPVTVTGSAGFETLPDSNTEKEALRNAFQLAVKKALSTFAWSGTGEFEINRLQDEITPNAEKYIVNYKELREWNDNEKLNRKVLAYVSLEQIKKDIRDLLQPPGQYIPRDSDSRADPVIGFVLTAWEVFGIGDRDKRPLKGQVLIDSFQEQFKNKGFDIKALDKAREYASTIVRQNVGHVVEDKIRKTLAGLASEANANYVARGEFDASFKGLDEATGNIEWGGTVSCEIINTSTAEVIASYSKTLGKFNPDKIEGLSALMHSAAKNAAKTLAGQTLNEWLKQADKGIVYNIMVENITSSERRKLSEVFNKICKVRRPYFDSEKKVLKLDILFEGSGYDLENMILNDRNIEKFKNFETKNVSGNSITFHFRNRIWQP